MPDIEAIRTAAEELKALSEKATALPWVDVSREGFGIRSIGENGEGFIQVCDEPPSDDRPEDMAYIVAACNLAPALLSLTDSLTAERDELRRAIQLIEAFYDAGGSDWWDAIHKAIALAGDGPTAERLRQEQSHIAERREGE